MATNSLIYSIELSKDRTYFWRGLKKTYDGIASKLGIKIFEPGKALPENGSFGGEQKPSQVNIRTKEGGSYVRFIATDKIEEQVHKRKLIGQKIKGKNNKDETICYVSLKRN